MNRHGKVIHERNQRTAKLYINMKSEMPKTKEGKTNFHKN